MLRIRALAVGIAVALHGGLLAGVLLHRTPETVEVSPIPDPFVVTLLPRARAAAPRPEAVPLPSPPAVRTPSALSRPALAPLVPELTAFVDVDRIDMPSELAPEPTPRPAAPLQAEASMEQAPVSTAVGDARDSWEGRVLARLERVKRFPPAARSRREQGSTILRFRVNRQGRVLSSSIARSSGSAVLDREALATLARAQPLSPIPADRPDQIELVVPVEFLLRLGRGP